MLNESQLNNFHQKYILSSNDRCWEWTAGKDSFGYGRFGFNGKTIGAHRLSWMLANEAEIPAGKLILHSCDNPHCVNPAHLKPGNHVQNMREKVERGRSARGENNGAVVHIERMRRADGHYMSKLTKSQACEVLSLKVAGIKQAEVAERFKISRSQVCRIWSGKHWLSREPKPERLPGGTNNSDTSPQPSSAAPVDRVVGQSKINEEIKP